MAADLTAKQQAFVREYLIDSNATQAAIRAGYSARTAEQQGSRLLRNVQVAKAVASGQDELAARASVDADWVRERLVENVNRAMQEVPVTDDDGNPVGIYVYAGAVANKALELLGRNFGMFKRDADTRSAAGLSLERLIELAGEADACDG